MLTSDQQSRFSGFYQQTADPHEIVPLSFATGAGFRFIGHLRTISDFAAESNKANVKRQNGNQFLISSFRFPVHGSHFAVAL